MTAELIDLTEQRLKRKFVEEVNFHIRCYNQFDESFHPYHEAALCSHQATAGKLGWRDVSILICDQCCRIHEHKEPKPISIQGM